MRPQPQREALDQFGEPLVAPSEVSLAFVLFPGSAPCSPQTSFGIVVGFSQHPNLNIVVSMEGQEAPAWVLASLQKSGGFQQLASKDYGRAHSTHCVLPCRLPLGRAGPEICRLFRCSGASDSSWHPDLIPNESPYLHFAPQC